MFIRTFRSGFRAFLLSVFSLVALVGLSTSCIVDDFDSVYNVTIKYYYNDADGSVKSREVCMVVPSGEKLAGSPLLWDDRWPNGTGSIQFGYTGDGKKGAQDVIYTYKSTNGVWQFNEKVGRGAPDGEWDTSMPVNRSLLLEPRYIREDGEEEITLYFKYNKPSVSVQKGFEEVVEERTIALSKITGSGVSLESLQSGASALGLFSLEKSDDYGYGYMDASDHNKFYYFNDRKNSSGTTYKEYICYDANGNRLDGVHSTLDKMITADMDGYTYRPNYIPAGYKNIPADENADGGIFDMEQVFIPGNKNKDGSISPFPYTHSGNQANHIYSYIYNSGDWFETALSVPDMYVMDETMTTALMNRIFTKYPDLKTKYGWSDTNQIAADYVNNVLKGGNSGTNTHISYLTSLSSMNIANLLTEYYNRIHPNDEPLALVYHYELIPASSTAPAQRVIQFNSAAPNPLTYVFYGSTDGSKLMASEYLIPAANKSYLFVYSDPDANGFRLPYHYELEYWSRIITDERLLPDPSLPQLPTNRSAANIEAGWPTYFDPVIRPTAENKLKNYFQSFLGAFSSSINNPAYVGSGAGLAVYRNGEYDTYSNRTFTQVAGRSANNVATTRDNLKKDSSNNEIDYNRRNGAGLWGMTVCGYQQTQSRYNNNNVNSYIACGNTYGVSSPNTGIGGFSALSYNVGGSTSSYISNTNYSLRLCRNVR